MTSSGGRYFAANPADQALFSKFAGVAHGDLAGNSAFQAQTLVVMQYMEKIVNSLGGGAADLMAAQVPSHKGWGVDSSYFKVSSFFCLISFERNTLILHLCFVSLQKMFDFIPGFMADNGADGACVNAWKSAGAELVAATK